MMKEISCLALVYTSQWLRHCFLAYLLHSMVMAETKWYLLTKSILFGKLDRWSLQLLEFDITCMTLIVIKGQ